MCVPPDEITLRSLRRACDALTSFLHVCSATDVHDHQSTILQSLYYTSREAERDQDKREQVIGTLAIFAVGLPSLLSTLLYVASYLREDSEIVAGLLPWICKELIRLAILGLFVIVALPVVEGLCRIRYSECLIKAWKCFDATRRVVVPNHAG